MSLDSMPGGSHRRKADPKRLQKIRQGGRRADQIKRQADRAHRAVEVPEAERELASALSQFYDDK